MSNVVALTLRADAVRRAADGYDDAWNAYFRSVYRIYDHKTAMQLADSHVERLKERDDEILAAVAVAVVEPEHA